MTWYLKLAELAYSATQPRWRRWLYIVPAVIGGLYVALKVYSVNKERERLQSKLNEAQEDASILRVRLKSSQASVNASVLEAQAVSKAVQAEEIIVKLKEATAVADDLKAEIELVNDLRSLKDKYDHL